MLLGCCHCRGGSSSSSSSKSSVSSAASSAASGSLSADSGSAPSGGDSTRECLICNGQVAPAVFQFEWNLIDNCPADPGNPTVGCYERSLGPFFCGNDHLNPNADFLSHGRLLPESVCVWSNNSTGEVEGGFPPNYCGECDNGPAISIAVGVDGVGQYFIWVCVSFFWSCTPPPGPGPPPAAQEGFVSLLYEKYATLPFNCLAVNELDLLNATGNIEFPTPGGFEDGGWGPGCNLAFGTAPFGTGFAESSFPLMISIKPSP